MKLIVFDIDGTLIQTSSIDAKSFIKALGNEFEEIKPDWNSFPHVTDSCIFNECVKLRFGRETTQKDRSEFQLQFTSLIVKAFEETPLEFSPVPGALKVWTELPQLGWNLAIASGGWKQSAQFKLNTLGISADSVPSAFADDALSREEIVQFAIERAKKQYQSQEIEKLAYVGDGLWDAKTCKNLNIPFIGIGAGTHANELFRLGALTVLPDLLDLPVILQKLFV